MLILDLKFQQQDSDDMFELRDTGYSIEIRQSGNGYGVYLIDITIEDFKAIISGKKKTISHPEIKMHKATYTNVIIKDNNEFITITFKDFTNELQKIQVPRLVWISFYNLLLLAEEN